MNEAHDVVRNEAMRVVPGILSARIRDDAAAGAVLIRSYQEYADDYGLSKSEAWMVLWTATMHWALEMAGELSNFNKVPAETYVQMMGMTALAWLSDEAVTGE